MSAAYVNSSANYNTTQTLTGCTAGNVLVVFFAGAATGTCSVSTTAGATSAWTSLGTVSGGGSQGFAWWASVSSSGTVTVTKGGTMSDPGGSIVEFSGVLTTAPQEGAAQVDYSASNTTSFATPNITASIADEALVGWWMSEEADSTITPAAGWSARQNTSAHIDKLFTKVITGTGDYNFSGTKTSTKNYAVLFVMLKGSGAAPPAGRTTKNTSTRGMLGMNLGMRRRT
jgi:hypothetical protein